MKHSRKTASSNILQKYSFKYLFWSSARWVYNKIPNREEFELITLTVVENFRRGQRKFLKSVFDVTMLDDKIRKANQYVIEEGGEEEKLQAWKVEPSSAAKNCRNFIREIVDNLDLKPNPEKPVIALSIGLYMNVHYLILLLVISRQPNIILIWRLKKNIFRLF